jgi:phage terminase Nu1 subunit (DNA packaging protein)
MAEGVPAKTLADLLDMDERIVRQYAKKGIFVKAGHGQYMLAPSVRNYVRHLREVAAGRQGNELNAVDENARLKIVMRRNYELKNAALDGTLISIPELTDAWGALCLRSNSPRTRFRRAAPRFPVSPCRWVFPHMVCRWAWKWTASPAKT